MQPLKKLLIAFEKKLKVIKSPILEKLNPGIRDWKIYENIPVLPPEIKTLYEWRNGTKISTSDSLGRLWLFRMGVFRSFEKALETYHLNTKTISNLGESKFPIFASGGGELHLFECNVKSKDYGMIFYYDIGSIDHDELITMYDSMETFAETMNECFLKNAYTYSDAGEIQFNHELEAIISKPSNPRSEYWKPFAMDGKFID